MKAVLSPESEEAPVTFLGDSFPSSGPCPSNKLLCQIGDGASLCAVGRKRGRILCAFIVAGFRAPTLYQVCDTTTRLSAMGHYLRPTLGLTIVKRWEQNSDGVGQHGCILRKSPVRLLPHSLRIQV